MTSSIMAMFRTEQGERSVPCKLNNEQESTRQSARKRGLKTSLRAGVVNYPADREEMKLWKIAR